VPLVIPDPCAYALQFFTHSEVALRNELAVNRGVLNKVNFAPILSLFERARISHNMPVHNFIRVLIGCRCRATIERVHTRFKSLFPRQAVPFHNGQRLVFLGIAPLPVVFPVVLMRRTLLTIEDLIRASIWVLPHFVSASAKFVLKLTAHNKLGVVFGARCLFILFRHG
jgi:hypothetical protein